MFSNKHKHTNSKPSKHNCREKANSRFFLYFLYLVLYLVVLGSLEHICSTMLKLKHVLRNVFTCCLMKSISSNKQAKIRARAKYLINSVYSHTILKNFRSDWYLKNKLNKDTTIQRFLILYRL